MVIPDVHQNFEFLEAISSQENFSNFEKIVFLGDFLDAKEPEFRATEAIEKTLNFVVQSRLSNPGRVEVLLGNHDILHFALSSESVQSFEKSALIEYFGMPKPEVISVCRRVDSFWDFVKIAVEVDGYVLSHAGINGRYWNRCKNPAENVEELNRLKSDIVDSENNLSELFQAGRSRGGSLEKGGPIWLDWNTEFDNEIGIPQIVGHTVGAEYRKNGCSYCLDAMQRSYGVVSESGVIIKHV